MFILVETKCKKHGDGDSLPGQSWCRIFKVGTQNAKWFFLMKFGRIFSSKKCHQEFVSTFGCQGCSSTSLGNALRNFPNPLFGWNRNGPSADIYGVLGVGASARVFREALSGKKRFGFEKKGFHKSTVFIAFRRAWRHGVTKQCPKCVPLEDFKNESACEGKPQYATYTVLLWKCFSSIQKWTCPPKLPQSATAKFEASKSTIIIVLWVIILLQIQISRAEIHHFCKKTRWKNAFRWKKSPEVWMVSEKLAQMFPEGPSDALEPKVIKT